MYNSKIHVFLHLFSVTEKENLVVLPAKKEESHKREINRDGEKEDKNKRLRKAESKENIQPSVEKKQVCKIIGMHHAVNTFLYSLIQYFNRQSHRNLLEEFNISEL